LFGRELAWKPQHTPYVLLLTVHRISQFVVTLPITHLSLTRTNPSTHNPSREKHPIDARNIIRIWTRCSPSLDHFPVCSPGHWPNAYYNLNCLSYIPHIVSCTALLPDLDRRRDAYGRMTRVDAYGIPSHIGLARSGQYTH